MNDTLSLGFGLSYFTGTVDNVGEVYGIESFPETFWDRNPFLAERLWATSSFVVDDWDLGFNVGILWSFAESWRLGGVYRQGPRFDYLLVNRAGPFNPLPDGTIVGLVDDRSIAFPDVWGLGVAYRSRDGRLTVGFEWDRVEYTVIMETLGSEEVDTTDVGVDDANELHVGVEYVFFETSPLIAIRGGLWRDPDHRFRYEGDDPFASALYPPGEDTLHLSVGVGVAFRRFQVDISADFANTVDQFSVSGIFNF